jgi:hypothetical protein
MVNLVLSSPNRAPMKTLIYSLLIFGLLAGNPLSATNGPGNGKQSVMVRGEVSGNQMMVHIPSQTPDAVRLEFPSHSEWNLVAKHIVPGGVTVVLEFDGVIPSNGKVIVDEPWVIVGIDNITGVRSEGNNNDDVTFTQRFAANNNHIDEGGSGSDQGNNNSGTSTETENDAPSNSSGNTGNTTISEIGIYPNPVSSKATVVTVGEILLRSVQVYDLSGRMVGDVKANNNRAEFDLSGYNNGVYMVMVQTNEGTKIHKIFKVQ